MDFLGLLRLPSDGWRKTAVINTSIVGLFAVANVSTLIWSLSKSSISENNVFRKGDCDEISLINTLLHLLLNIASTLMIASSNFFMQVLNSPTRAEVDRAHARKQWLEIGVPSLRNVLNVSPYKSLAWLLFSLSSVPIHLFFNSSVFTVDYSGSKWSMAVVSESLLRGAPYYAPGAGLTLNGTQCENASFGLGDFELHDTSQIPTAVIASATQSLSVAECKSEYQGCGGLRKYRNLLLVIASGSEPTDSQGWVVSDLYNMEETPGNVYNWSYFPLSDNEILNETFRSIWEPYLEDTYMSQPNSLWFSSPCFKIASDSPDGCKNSCTGPLGLSESMDKPMINETELKASKWEYPWLRSGDSISALRSRSTLGKTVYSRTWAPISSQYECYGLPRPLYKNDSTNNIRVQYCLAEPFEPVCKLAISNILLLVVTGCIFTKLILCMSVVLALSDDPLVTPGDAVVSFIIVPDPTTIGRCAAAIPDMRSRPWERKPLHWQGRSKRQVRSISPANWITNYIFFLVLLVILGLLMDRAFSEYPLSDV